MLRDENTRHRLVSAATRAQLDEFISSLEARGWNKSGEPSVATTVNPHERPYWTQAMALTEPAVYESFEQSAV